MVSRYNYPPRSLSDYSPDSYREAYEARKECFNSKSIATIDGIPFYTREDLSDYYNKKDKELKALYNSIISTPVVHEPFSLERIKRTELYDAAWFCQIFKPYLKKYTKFTRTYGTEKWITIKRRKSLKSLQKIITEGKKIGYFTSIRTPVIGIDLDFHHIPGGGWTTTGEPKPCLLSRYKAIVHRFGYFPTVISKSPTGLHVYYILSHLMLHHKHLKALVTEKLKGVEGMEYTDILPSPNHSLRIPTQRSLLNPETFTPLSQHLSHIPWQWISERTFTIADLFGEHYITQIRAFNLKTSKAKKAPKDNPESLQDYKMQKILKAEAKLLPFTNFHSNEILIHLVPKYRGYGMSVNETISRLQYHLQHSPDYTRSLRDPEKLSSRIKAMYAIEWDRFKPGESWNTIIPERIEDIINNHPFVKQRTKGIKKYFNGLISWKAYHDQTHYDKGFLAYMDDMYPYYAVNCNKGLYPLPSSVQHSWNKNYHSLLPWLLEIGILKESGLGYSAQRGICKYYYINI